MYANVYRIYSIRTGIGTYSPQSATVLTLEKRQREKNVFFTPIKNSIACRYGLLDDLSNI